MSDRYVEDAKGGMGTIERLLKGLPGIRGYVDKEIRRDADKRVRDLIARELEEQKQALFQVQQEMLRAGGLRYMAGVDAAIQKLQILIDRVKTASYGYAGLFDPVNIKAEQLDALYRFDVAVAKRVSDVETAVAHLGQAFAEHNAVDAAVTSLTTLLIELNTLFGKRTDAIVNPDLLLDDTFVPEMPGNLPDLPELKTEQ